MSRDTIPLWKRCTIYVRKEKILKTILSEEYYAIPVSLAQDKLKDIKCQLKYEPIYLCVFFCCVSSRFLWLICRVFILFSLAQLSLFSLYSSCGVSAFFLFFHAHLPHFYLVFFLAGFFFISLLPALTLHILCSLPHSFLLRTLSSALVCAVLYHWSYRKFPAIDIFYSKVILRQKFTSCIYDPLQLQY